MGAKSPLIIPVGLIIVGTGWLLSVAGVMPGINWIWTLSLAGLGVVTFFVSGFDKVSFVIGSLFLVASVLSVLRQTGRLPLDMEVPILVVLCGVLMLIARLPIIPLPKWIDQVKVSED